MWIIRFCGDSLVFPTAAKEEFSVSMQHPCHFPGVPGGKYDTNICMATYKLHTIDHWFIDIGLICYTII